MTQILFGRIEQSAQLIFLVSNRFIRDQYLLDPRCDGRFGLQDIDDRHDPGLRLCTVGGQEFLRRFQCGLGHFQILIGEDDFPIGLLHCGQDGEDAIAKDMFFHGGIILCDADESFGDINSRVAEERLREGEYETACIGRVEQEACGHILVYIGSSRAVVQIDVATGQ